MNIISGNPYRLLGVYSNSPIKDRIANANKMKAYLKVGKSVSFPLDLLNLIPAPVRLVENMEHANGSINLPQDQLKYALFWFIKVTSIDEIAMGYLQKGETEKAKELFGKKETFSSLINLGVLSLIQNDQVTAVQTITKVIHNDDYRVAFVEEVCGSTYQLPEDDLARLFINELLVEAPIQNLMQLFFKYGTSEEDNSYLKDKAIAEPIAIISAEIAKAKNVKNDDFNAQYRAGFSLKNNTKEPLDIIRSLLKKSDMQYQMIADNLAKQILQCGINYYNNTDEDEYVKIDKRIKVLHLSIAGLSIARNAGMRIASAPYIGFVDSDDYVEPAMFEKMLDAMVQSDAEIAYCNFLLEYEFKPNESPYRNSGDIVIRDPKNVLQDMMMEKVSCSACTKLYKSDFLTSLQFPEGKNYEDRLVMYEWVALCKKVVWVDSPFYHYVERQTSICHTMSPMNLYHYFLAEYGRMRFMEKYSLFEEEDLFKIRTRLIGTCLTIFKEILLKVNLREFKEPVKDMRQKMKEIAALPEDTYELKYRRRVRKIAYHWHLYYLTHFLFKKGGDS